MSKPVIDHRVLQSMRKQIEEHPILVLTFGTLVMFTVESLVIIFTSLPWLVLLLILFIVPLVILSVREANRAYFPKDGNEQTNHRAPDVTAGA